MARIKQYGQNALMFKIYKFDHFKNLKLIASLCHFSLTSDDELRGLNNTGSVLGP